MTGMLWKNGAVKKKPEDVEFYTDGTIMTNPFSDILSRREMIKHYDTKQVKKAANEKKGNCEESSEYDDEESSDHDDGEAQYQRDLGKALQDSADLANKIKLDDYLKDRNMMIKAMGDDGNCLFRAIADQHINDQEFHVEYRNLALEYINPQNPKTPKV